MKRKGQLFLIEVIIALSVLVVLISVLFTVQTFTPPPNEENLDSYGESAIDIMVEDGLMYSYLEKANYSFYTLDNPIMNATNGTKLQVRKNIEASLPSIANFKLFVERYNTTANSWERIDILNFDQSLPSGSSVEVVEYYTPGFNGDYAEFKVQLFLWNEVSA